MYTRSDQGFRRLLERGTRREPVQAETCWPTATVPELLLSCALRLFYPSLLLDLDNNLLILPSANTLTPMR